MTKQKGKAMEMTTTKLTQIDLDDDAEYGNAANGIHVGSGFDCEIKRESRLTALVNVTTPNGSGDWLMSIDVQPDTDLQQRAVEIARSPDFGNGGYVTSDDDAWGDLAERWDAIEVLCQDDTTETREIIARLTGEWE